MAHKFVQITCSSVALPAPRLGEFAESLFALDEDGSVWRFKKGITGDDKDSEWIRLPARK